MPNFIVFWWRKKKTVSFAGKGAGSAKKWILHELDKLSDDEEDTGIRGRIGKMGTEEAGDIDLKTVPLKVELASDVNDIEMTDSRKPRPLRNPRHSPPGVGLKPGDSPKPLNTVRRGLNNSPISPSWHLGLGSDKKDTTTNDKSLLTLTRSEALSGGRGLKGKELRRSA